VDDLGIERGAERLAGLLGAQAADPGRGTVDRAMNLPGDPIIGADRSWWEMERDKLRFDPVVLRRCRSSEGGGQRRHGKSAGQRGAEARGRELHGVGSGG